MGGTGDDPLQRFAELFAQAQARSTADATAAALATADAEGRPAVRIVLVKGVDAAGFRFFTNLRSRKARDLEENPRAALCFYWPELAQQVRVEGTVEQLSGEHSDAYFRSRARDSQLGAWASRQSAVLPSRQLLEERLALVADRYAAGEVPRPPFWGGYLLIPERIEFWSGREHRLHDRLLYRRDDGGWQAERLYP